MTTWQEIGVENFQAARDLYRAGRYRSSVSRVYYAVFSLLTAELSRRGVTFRAGRQTPSHAELPELITQSLTQFSEARRLNVARLVLRLYRLRLDADYTVQRIDRITAAKALGDAEKLFRYFGAVA